MGLSVGVANPGTISSVGNANPGTISSVGNATPGRITSVGVLGQPQPVGYQPAQGGVVGSAYGSGGGGGGGYSAPRQVYAPKLDVAAVNARARQAAEGGVNPYYTKVLNEFLSQIAVQRQRSQTQYDTDVKSIQDQLAQALEQSQLSRGRTTEDVAKTQANINQTADEFQTDSGQQFTDERLALARGTAQSGLTGGLGAQAQETAVEGRNKAETRQAQQFQEHREQQDLFKSRTFEDLARSDTQNKDKGDKAQKQRKFDLDSYIINSQNDEANRRNDLEKARQQDIDTNTHKFAKDEYNSYIRGISDPAQRLAAAQQYGSSF